jgi:xanthine dehydrogenase YagT iron-sulfur-binding subunit
MLDGRRARDGYLHQMQRSFIEHDAFQCGYCTLGQIVSAVGMLEEVEAGWPSLVTEDFHAAGTRVRDLPITPDKVIR